MIEINNKILFAIIAFGLALAALGGYEFATEHSSSDFMFRIGIIIFIFSGTYILVKNGIFIKSDEYRFTRLGIAIFTLGLIMSIMHWTSAKEIMLIGYLSIPFIYLFHLIKHKRTKWTDFLKFFLALTLLLSRAMATVHVRHYEEVACIGVAILLILLVDALVNKKISMNE